MLSQTRGAYAPMFSEHDVFRFLKLDYELPHMRCTYENFVVDGRDDAGGAASAAPGAS